MSAAEISSVRVDAWGQTDVGLRRENNEDHFVIMKLSRRAEVLQTSVTEPLVFQGLRRQEGWLFMVADGVGGHRGGELASQTAITSLARYLTQAAGCFNTADSEKENEVLEQLEAAVHDAHRRISEEHGGSSAGEPGPATTLTMIMLVWPRAYVVHVGDSRAFFLRKGRLRQLTRDQTTGEFMMGIGAWTEEQARNAPIAGALVSALGASSMTPSVGLVDLQPGDALLLCSDGLTRCVPDERIAEMLGAASAESACRELVQAALAAGGPDNITVVAARMVPS
jgi:serine/threonine protein phosphatase PrpC